MQNSSSFWLPLPSDESVEEFRKLLKVEFGVELDDLEVKDAVTRLLQIYFIKTYAKEYFTVAPHPTRHDVAPAKPQPKRRRSKAKRSRRARKRPISASG